jgi:hypothetical protein
LPFGKFKAKWRRINAFTTAADDCEALLGFKSFFKMRNRIKNIKTLKQGTTQHQSISAKGIRERQMEKRAQNWHFKN